MTFDKVFAVRARDLNGLEAMNNEVSSAGGKIEYVTEDGFYIYFKSTFSLDEENQQEADVI